MPAASDRPVEIANRLRPVLLHLNRHLRREVHTSDVSPGQLSLLGLIAGYGLSWAADTWRLIPLNAEVYAVPYVPFHSSALDAVWIAAAAIAICLAATLLPARAAARILPVEILRFE